MKKGKWQILAGLIAFIAVLVLMGYVWFEEKQVNDKSSDRVSPSATSIPDELDNFVDFSSQVQIEKYQYLKTLSSQRISDAQRSFLRQDIAAVVPSISVYNLWISIPLSSTEGDTSIIKAQVFVPQTSQSLPLVVYGSGTTGIAPNCAPSLENVAHSNIGNYFNQMTTLASLGYVVVFPDYEGFEATDKTHPYFVADLEARTMLGSIEALSLLQTEVESLPVINFEQIFLMGYSQGGHAALAGAVHHEWLSSDKKIAGVIGYAPAFNVQALLVESPRLAPYLLYAYYKHYRLNTSELESVLLSQHLLNLERDVQQHCIDTIYSYYPANPEGIYHSTFWQYLITEQLDKVVPEFYQALQPNQAQLWKTTVPIYIIQGKQDNIVTPVTQLKNAQQFCQNNIPITYTLLDGANHFQTPKAGTVLAHQWMQNTIQHTSRNDCESILN